MARKVFISFLGTNDYLECHYSIEEKKSSATRFVQEALIDYYCKYWTENDQIVIFGTEKEDGSIIKNWLDGGQIRKDGEPKSVGLQSILKSKNLRTNLNDIAVIPEGFTQDEIWMIFQTVFNKLENNDEIYLDVTHAFRSIPMFSTILLNYARLLKHTELKAIHYGAFEKLGPAFKVKAEIPIENRIAPVLDLMPLVDLQDWTIAARNYIDYGKTDKIHLLLEEKYKKELSTSDEARKLRKLDEAMQKHSEAIIANKLDDIIKDSGVKKNLEVAKETKTITPDPFVPLFDIIEKKVNNFQEKDLYNVFSATEWCINHELYQNAYSILLEGTISLLLDKINEEYTGQTLIIEIKRGVVTYIANYKMNEKSDNNDCCRKSLCIAGYRIPEKLNDEQKKKIKDTASKLWDIIDDNLTKTIVTLNIKRNAYMHAGTGTNPLGSFTELKNNLQKCYNDLKSYFSNTNPANQSSTPC